MTTWIALLFACWGENAYIIEGTVVEVRGEQVVLDHEAVAGLMPAMIMPFDVADPAMLTDLTPGDRVYGRYELREGGGALMKLRVTGHGPPPAATRGPAPLQPEEGLPAMTLDGHRGSPVVVGHGQPAATALTFIYTRCPLPEACPAMMSRMRALEQALPPDSDVRLVAVTLDPAYDSVDVLAGYAGSLELGPRWHLARAEPAALSTLAAQAGLPVLEQDGEIVHGLRLLLLDREGKLLARYDDARWPLEPVVGALVSGKATQADAD